MSNSTQEENNKCIICGTSNKYYGWQYLCQNCYKECLEEIKTLKGRHNVELYRLYNSLKNKIITLTKTNYIKLVAIAKALGRYYFDDTLLNQVERDIINLQKKEIYTEPENQLTCIICGKPSNGRHFCLDCWKKYKDKSIDIRIKNCTETEIIDKYGNLKHICDDGHKVRSKSEKAIDDFLFKYDIPHIYEKSFPIDKNPEHDLHPDFYLPKLNIYIEHFGITSDKEYKETKEYKLPIYKKAGITLICTTEKDLDNLSASLQRKLKFFNKGKINYLDK